MSDQISSENLSPDSPPPDEYSQLYQARVPLDQAGDAFNTRDASGRIPIVVIPQRLSRIRNEMVTAAVLVLVGSIIAQYISSNWVWVSVGVPLALVLLVIGIYQSFIVRIPEGVNGLLTKGGRYYRTIGSGTFILPPWVLISHLVTRRQIPFDIPMIETPTSDNVMATIDMLVAFTISDAYRFVYSISADDFDQVFMAACQDALRLQVRQISSDEIVDLNKKSAQDLAATIGADVEIYGVTINKVNITYAGPPKDFIFSQEAQMLAVLKRKEQAEKQTLALQQQANEAELARLSVIAQVTRDREALQIQVQAAELEQRIVELRAQSEELRLERLEQRLKKYPLAARWEAESAQLDVARSLAGNTRAVVQVGHGSDIARAFVLSDTLSGKEAEGMPALGANDEPAAQKPAGRAAAKTSPKEPPVIG
jgi:regulator of protease activity HflC (stomatin/prohibitin superfamily)